MNQDGNICSSNVVILLCNTCRTQLLDVQPLTVIDDNSMYCHVLDHDNHHLNINSIKLIMLSLLRLEVDNNCIIAISEYYFKVKREVILFLISKRYISISRKYNMSCKKDIASAITSCSTITQCPTDSSGYMQWLSTLLHLEYRTNSVDDHNIKIACDTLSLEDYSDRIKLLISYYSASGEDIKNVISIMSELIFKPVGTISPDVTDEMYNIKKVLSPLSNSSNNDVVSVDIPSLISHVNNANSKLGNGKITCNNICTIHNSKCHDAYNSPYHNVIYTRTGRRLVLCNNNVELSHLSVQDKIDVLATLSSHPDRRRLTNIIDALYKEIKRSQSSAV